MSKLELMRRPWVEFDPTDRDHRKWYAEYVQTGTWGRCPVRFVDPTDCGNLAAAMQASMVRYYVKQEFRNLSKRPKIVNKMVDTELV
jgi:hypothetical protein